MASAAEVPHEAIPSLALFAVPKIELKTAASPAASSTGEVTHSASNQSDAELSVAFQERPLVSEISIQAYETMNGEALLQRVERPAELGGALGWLETTVWEPVFSPEVVKLGKVKVTGGVVAAIKRKNPFCLLNPLVFAAGW